MTQWLKQSTAVTVKLGPFVDSGDGDTDETALTIQKADVRLSKNGGNMAPASADQGTADAGAPHDELGYYDVSLDATDTGTLGTLDVIVHEAGALHVFKRFMVVPANVWDSMFGADKLQAHVVEKDSSLGLSTQEAADVGDEVYASIGAASLATAAGLSAVQADTDDIQARLPAVLTADGNIKADVLRISGSDVAADTVEANIANLDAAVSAVPTATENAEMLLKLDWTTITGEASRSVLNALRFLRNKWEITTGVLHVKKEDDTTDAFTSALSTDASSDPIVASDPS